ncbi:hypothetical protein SAMN05444166_6275 [Singulisphaera sp. GP187]|uniref:hypothetical protein n=1 Tax=Singulisphaera sp. GP187 TaxID=1882752 RepID=UPI00092A4CF9|nr:hypothetical protein [Singulisphaera sp. GP187]SIO60123.1 hypothetical protein SAMN05444166_6275 [Singulisphaera sp. GP187]
MADATRPRGESDASSPADPGDPTVGFSEIGAERIIDVVRYVEKLTRGLPAPRARGASGSSELRYAKTPSGGIPARSGTTVGKATCTLYHLEGDNLVADETAEVRNLFGSIVGSGGKFIVVGIISGRLGAISEDC